MPLLEDSAKPALLDEQKSLRDAQAGWAAMAVVLLPISVKAFYLPSALCAVVIAVLKRHENAVDRALADPPRADYRTRTRPRVRRFNARALGSDPLAQATGRAAQDLLYAASYLEAFVRAEERALGAQLTGERTAVEQRLGEAARFMKRTWDAHARIADEGDELAQVWAEWGRATAPLVDDLARQHAIPPIQTIDVVRDLDSPRRELLERTGLVISDLDTMVSFPPTLAQASWEDRVVSLDRSTRQLGRTAERVTRELPRELPPPPHRVESVARRAARADFWGFEVYQDRSSAYRWRLLASNRQVVATSRQAFSRQLNAVRAATNFKESASRVQYEAYVDTDGGWRWRARAANGEVVAVSADAFVSRSTAQRAIDIVREYAGGAVGP